MKLQTLTFLALTMAATTARAQDNTRFTGRDVKAAMRQAEAQSDVLLKNIPSATTMPELVSPRTVEDGKLKMVVSKDWTSGFFPAQMWYYYAYSKDKKWLELAKTYSAKIEKEKFNTTTHDLGFMIFCPFGNGYRLTKDTAYKNIIIQAARSLSTRFNARAGVIKSWDHNTDKWKYPVIIDNMMNLELLFNATKLTGDSSFYKIAVTHANTTMKNHFRPDYSSWHVIDYDIETGEVRNKLTAQGYSNNSAWARGQAWALYGYTVMYRETHNKRYLEQAEHIADFILTHKNLPEDKVPFWDYDDPAIPNTSRDASAAAIASSALFELSKYSKRKQYFKQSATAILSSLNKKYTSKPGENFGFILEHSTGHRPAKSEIDVPINYADYYYIEALMRSQNKFNFKM